MGSDYLVTIRFKTVSDRTLRATAFTFAARGRPRWRWSVKARLECRAVARIATWDRRSGREAVPAHPRLTTPRHFRCAECVPGWAVKAGDVRKGGRE